MPDLTLLVQSTAMLTAVVIAAICVISAIRVQLASLGKSAANRAASFQKSPAAPRARKSLQIESLTRSAS